MVAEQDLYRRWGHSFEEDHDGVEVYRPFDFPFPRARGRASIELRADGTWVDWAVGRGDAPERRTGQWVGEGQDGEGQRRMSVRIGDSARVLEVRAVAPDRLEITRMSP